MEKMKTTLIIQSTTLNVEEGEYVKDGVIYCALCNTARSVTLDGRVYRCKCKCEAERAEAERKAEREQLKAMDNAIRSERLRKMSLLGERYKHCRFGNSDIRRDASFVKALERCRRYCESAREVVRGGHGIYLYGKTGVGKTHLVACMINELIEKGYSCLITNLQGLMHARIRDEDGYDMAINVQFLFLDDIGTERMRKDGEDLWAQEVLYEVINSRYVSGKPTGFTSNYEIGELIRGRKIEQRTVERIYEMSSAVIEIGGGSYRIERM